MNYIFTLTISNNFASLKIEDIFETVLNLRDQLCFWLLGVSYMMSIGVTSSAT